MKNLFEFFLFIFLSLQASHACQKMMINGHGVTEGDKNLILDYHNRMRQAVATGSVFNQPPAANMMALKWDEELATSAQKWATSCNFHGGHDRFRHTRRFPVGQNIASTWTSHPPKSTYDMMADFHYPINVWFNENKNYRFGVYSGPSSAGHYTQLIWADSDLIGCGYAYYLDIKKGFVKTYVCNYGRSGNILGAYPYIKGYPSCQNYNLIPSSKYPGLCDKVPISTTSSANIGFYFAFRSFL